MLKAVLLDLDNTLVLFDEPDYYRRFTGELADFFSDLIDPGSFRDRLFGAISALGRNRGRMPNHRFFLHAFTEGTGMSQEDAWRRFMSFYETRYEPFGAVVGVPDGLFEVLAHLAGTGLRRVITSNPFFPVIAQKKRLAWAGIDDTQFDFFTHMENMSYIKPQLDYYRQVCEHIDVRPEECLMVGNDPVNDAAASGIGMRLYLTTDAGAIDYTSLSGDDPPGAPAGAVYTPDHRGPIAGVVRVIDDLLAERDPGAGDILMERRP